MTTISITLKASMRVPATVTARTLAAVSKASAILRRATGSEVAVGFDMPNGKAISPATTRATGRPRGTGRPIGPRVAVEKAVEVKAAEPTVKTRRRRRKRRTAKEED